jgi:hypothetical protein
MPKARLIAPPTIHTGTTSGRAPATTARSGCRPVNRSTPIGVRWFTVMITATACRGGNTSTAEVSAGAAPADARSLGTLAACVTHDQQPHQRHGQRPLALEIGGTNDHHCASLLLVERRALRPDAVAQGGPRYRRRPGRKFGGSSAPLVRGRPLRPPQVSSPSQGPRRITTSSDSHPPTIVRT